MAGLRVVLAGENPAALRDALERAGFRVVAEAESEDKALTLAPERSATVIVHAGRPDVHCGAVPTVVVGEDRDVALAAALGAFAVLPRGCTDEMLAAAVELAVERFRELASVHADLIAVRDQLETRKVVERAKGILMTRLKISEPDAYRRLQKASQDENRKMREIAESIIQTERILGVRDAG